MRVLEFVNFFFRDHSFNWLYLDLFLNFQLVEIIFMKVSTRQLRIEVESIPDSVIVVSFVTSSPVRVINRCILRFILDIRSAHFLPLLLGFGDFVRQE